MASDRSSSKDLLSDIEIRSHIIEEMRNYTSIYDKSDPQHSRHDRKIEIYEATGVLVGLTCEYFYS